MTQTTNETKHAEVIKSALAHRDLLPLLEAATGATIKIHRAPLVSDYLVIKREGATGYSRFALREAVDGTGPIGIAYETVASGDRAGEIVRIYVGSKWHGPLLSWSEGRGWVNLYSKGNYGNNYTHGGTWASDPKRCHETMMDALKDRDYTVAGGSITCDRNRMTEPPALFGLLADIAANA